MAEASRQRSSAEVYGRLLGYVKPYWHLFGVAILAMVVTAATEPVLPALLKPLLDGSFVKRDMSNIHLIPIAIVGLFVLRGVFSYVGDYALSWVSNKVVLDLRNAMFARLLALPTRYYDDQSSGALLSKVAYDVTGVTGAATGVLTVLVRDTLTVVLLLSWLLYLNWKLTLVTLVITPGIALVVKLFSTRMRRMSRESLKAMGDVTHVLEESIECHKVVKIFGGQEYEARRFDASGQKLRGYG